MTADNVTIRNCEIRNATGNGIGVFGKNTVIENCRIHHLLNSTYADQSDAHGVTGRWSNVTIRNSEIYYVSGDCVQFDPDRLCPLCGGTMRVIADITDPDILVQDHFFVATHHKQRMEGL